MAENSESGEEPKPTISLVMGERSEAALLDTKSLPDTHGTDGPPAREAAAPQRTEIPGYDVLKLLGRGGMGAVYQARDLKLKRLVALKMILAGAQASPGDLDRFRQEGEAVAKLQHPHIVQIYEVGEFQGQPYFALEFVGGPTLAQHLAGALLPDADAARLVETLARAIHVAHSHGIVHRDLKPGNVLLAEGFVPKITDFGLAKQLDDDSTRTASGVILGTPSYMAPEQAFGDNKHVGPLSDVYALGAILYECVTGRPPFRAATTIETVLQVRNEEPVPPASLRPRLARDLGTICLKALHKDPARRYASAEALADDLARFLRQEPILARSVSRAERAWRWCRRKPLAASLLATIVFALVAISSTMVFTYSRVSAALVVETEERHKAVQAAIREKSAKDAAVLAAERETAAKLEAVQATKDAVQAQQATEVALESADQNLSLSQMRLAQQYWLNNDIPEAEQLLDRCPLDHRNWEWHYLKRLCHSELKVLNDDRNFCNAQYSKDGRFLVTGGDASGLRLWDAEHLRVIRSFPTDGLGIQSVAISATGERVAALLNKGILLTWNAETGERIATIAGIDGTFRNRLSFSPDGQRIAGPKGIVCDVTTGKILFRTLNENADHAFFPDGQLLTGSGTAMRIWDQDGKEVRKLLVTATSAIDISADGRWIAIGLGDGVEIVDAATGEKRLSFRAQTDSVSDLCFSEDGKRIAACCGDRAVRVWDIENTLLLSTLRGHERAPLSVSFDREGKRLASSSPDGVRVWESDNDPETTHWQTGGGLIVVDPVRSRFVTCGQDVTDLVVRDCDTGQEISRRPSGGAVLCAAYSHDGRTIATGGPSGITLWDGETSDKRHDLATPAAVTRVAFGTGGTTLVSASADHKVRLWEVDPGKEVAAAQLNGEIYRLAPFPDSPEVALLTQGRIIVWDTSNPKQAKLFPAERVLDFALSADGTQIATTHSYETGVQLWDRKKQERLANLAGKYSMGRVAFHPLGDRVIASTSAVAPVSQAIVWDCASGQEVLVFRERGLVRFLTEVTFSSRGDFLFAQGATYTRRWDARPSSQDFALTGHGGWVNGVAYRGTDELLTSSSDGHVRLWELRRGHLQAKVRAGNVRALDTTLLAQGQQIITISDKVRRWDLAEQKQLVEYDTGNKAVNRVAVSPDEKSCAIVGGDPVVRLMNVADGALIDDLKLHQKEVAEAAFSPDGQTMVTVGGDRVGGEVVIWDLPTGEGNLIPQPGLVRCVVFHPTNNTFVTASHDGQLTLWSLPGKVEQTLQHKPAEQLHALAISRDGKYVATGGISRVVDWWNLESREKLAELRQPQIINGLDFSPSGDQLAIALQGDLVRLVPLPASAH